MENNTVIISIGVLIFASLFLIGPVTAAINTIATGNYSIYWRGWTGYLRCNGGRYPNRVVGLRCFHYNSSPDYSISVTNPADFYISPTDFESRTGVWYRLNNIGNVNGEAFTVVDPQS